jgi:hypothetical protein
VAGPRGVYICNECVALCREIMGEDEFRPLHPALVARLPPQEQLRGQALSGVYDIHRMLATREYAQAVAEAQVLLDRLRTLHGLESGEAEGQDPSDE